MNSLKIMKSEISKEEEVLEYLRQDNGYWIENDVWQVDKSKKNLDFSMITNGNIKLELKHYFLYLLKEEIINFDNLTIKVTPVIIILSDKINSNKRMNSILDLASTKFDFYLYNSKFKVSKQTEKLYLSTIKGAIKFIEGFYDEREETEKDIWNCKKIVGSRFPASGYRNGNYRLDFTKINRYYQETIKKYLRIKITKKSYKHCETLLTILTYFIETFYSNDYKDGFLENLTRDDMEKFIFILENDYKDKSKIYKSQRLAFIKQFLDYIQIAEYEKAPRKDTRALIFKDDIPKRESNSDVIKRVKFIPEPIIRQIDENIKELDRPDFIPVYILMRETGWRGTDILNLRYDNCIEKIFNKSENKYNNYLCGEITKTGIVQLKIPIREKVAELIETSIEKTIEKSTEKNNPTKYLFNTYSGVRKGEAYSKIGFVDTVQRLIERKEINNEDGSRFHFRPHSLRHTRAKEYAEQGLGISVIKQILGHRSLQMTLHYIEIAENTLYEKWKKTEDLNLLNVMENSRSGIEIPKTEVSYNCINENLDAVKVPFGMCFKPSKIACKQQTSHCLTCASFCATTDNIPQLECEIELVENQIKTSESVGRNLWKERNEIYLKYLREMLKKVKEYGIVHKNGASREVPNNG